MSTSYFPKGVTAIFFPNTKVGFGFSHLRESDQKSVALVHELLNDVIDERMVDDFVLSITDEDYFGMSADEEKMLRQIERIFLSFMKERANEILGLRINEIVEDYDDTDIRDREYVERAIRAIKRSSKCFFEGEGKHG